MTASGESPASSSEPPTANGRVTLRKWVHILAVLPAFTLRWSGPAGLLAGTALLVGVNAFVLPRWRALWRPGELERRWRSGIVLYPLSLLLVALGFVGRPEVVAGAWGLLAVGDGAASLVGRRVAAEGGRLPWNRAKSWLGSGSFVVAGSLAAWGLVCWTAPGLAAGRVFLASLSAALVAAAAESRASRLEDNVAVTLVGAFALWAGLEVTGPVAVSIFGGVAAVVANAVFGFAAMRMGLLDRRGAVAAAVVGVLVALGTGLPGWLGLVAFFALGVGSTAYRRLRARTRARPAGGEERTLRGAGNVVANGGVAAVAAVLLGFGAPIATATAAFAGALAAATADTVGGEVGRAVGGPTVRVPDGARVPPGTDGGVSIAGTLATVLAAFTMAAVLAALGIVPAGSVAVLTIAGGLGAGLDTLLGGTLERHGLLDNEEVNFTSTLFAAWLAAVWMG